MLLKEEERLHEPSKDLVPSWKKWGAYLTERQWGTVREDYSIDGDAWNYFPHDMARSRAYRWGEDGIAGFCDRYQTLIFSFAFWNEKDPILKERLFGLNGSEGNHGEDVKELYYYLDATPTHSYLKYLYKYSQGEYPYDKLVKENQKRGTSDREYELLDTGLFQESRYFDIFIEYAKADKEDICIRIQACNRGKDKAKLHILPQLWFRNRWSLEKEEFAKPLITPGPKDKDYQTLYADPKEFPPPEKLPFDYHFSPMYLYADSNASLLFTNNATNQEKLWNTPNHTPYVKDAFHRFLVNKEDSLNPDQSGTKAAFHYDISIEGGQSITLTFRLTPQKLSSPFKDIDSIFSLRQKEADEFYASLQPPGASRDDKLIQRQALAGMLWSQQSYIYDVHRWLEGDDPKSPLIRRSNRNCHWSLLEANHILSMPDKWEYPWFASWDLCFHCIPLAIVDLTFAKNQLHVLLSHHFQHPSGQIPAYEWGFSDLNPPVQAWALWKLYQIEKDKKGTSDRAYLEGCFIKLVQNFGWWVNVEDKLGNNFFEGGFLGLDNISVIDRSKPLPSGEVLEQSDGTGWMGFFCLLMMRMSLELAKQEPVYEKIATVFFEHFVYIAAAMESGKAIDMWDAQDNFFYDIISYPDGRHERLKVRSLVGIIPFYSIDFLDEDELAKFPHFTRDFQIFLRDKKHLADRCITNLTIKGKTRYLLGMMNLEQMKGVLGKAWDPNEFKSDFGLRSLSKYHKDHPCHFDGTQVSYEPGESTEKIKGGNSNWRGPIWMPTAFLFVESLRTLHKAVGDEVKIAAPNENPATLDQMAQVFSNRLINLFRLDSSGKRPVHGDASIYKDDPYWKDLLLFYEHYQGDTGRGLGASHQTGWSGLVASLIQGNF